MNEPNEALVLDTDQEQEKLSKEVNSVENQAKSLEINNENDFVLVSEFLKSVKATIKKVKDYWEPLRLSAKSTYDDVLSKKKEMIEPLEIAEKILKEKIGSYTIQQEKKQKEKEMALKKLAEKERENKLQEAIDAEISGDLIGAEMAMAEAEVYDDASITATLQKQVPKASGISTRKTWSIKVVEPEKVPIDINGMIIRPVDEAAILKLVKVSKGKIKIPGIEIQETISVSARSK